MILLEIKKDNFRMKRVVKNLFDLESDTELSKLGISVSKNMCEELLTNGTCSDGNDVVIAVSNCDYKPESCKECVNYIMVEGVEDCISEQLYDQDGRKVASRYTQALKRVRSDEPESICNCFWHK